jgi:hypothetical protein
MDVREIGWGGMDWIDVAYDRDQCTFGFHKIVGNFCVAERLAASQLGLSPMKFLSYF